MRLKFKEQQFQLDAVKSVVDCFTGQEKETSRFNLDRGRSQKEIVGQVSAFDEEIGFKNKNIQIDSIDILKNIKEVQKRNGLIPSRTLKGKYNLTIEMETGERVIIVMGAVNVMKPRVSGTLNKYILCIA